MLIWRSTEVIVFIKIMIKAETTIEGLVLVWQTIHQKDMTRILNTKTCVYQNGPEEYSYPVSLSGPVSLTNHTFRYYFVTSVADPSTRHISKKIRQKVVQLKDSHYIGTNQTSMATVTNIRI